MDFEQVFNITVSITRYLLAGLVVLVLSSCVFSLVTRHFGSRVGSYLVESGTKKKLPLSHWENAIGRSTSCDVVLNVPTVSRFHAVISKRRKGWVVADTNSKTGVFVNGEQIKKFSPINHGDKISFGTVTFDFVDADVDDMEREERKKRRGLGARSPRPAQQSRFIPAIIDEAGDKAYIIGCDSCVIGRSANCDVRLNYPAISSVHARVFHQGNAWIIEDMESKTGTKVNARSIGGSQRRLKNGDIIGLGGVIFVFNENYKVRR